ncbi:MAG: ABC transporter permease [Pseudomonadota bacterium]
MAAALRAVARAKRSRVAAAAAALVAAPLLWAAAAAIAAGLDGAAWRALFEQAQLPRAIGLSVLTGLLATVISVALSAWLLSHTFATARWAAATRFLAPMLAVPHAAFAIGLAFLIAPSGWLLRVLSPWATGFTSPPPWSTTQDPWGLALVVALVGKEVPFLLWAAATQLQRADAGARWRRELAVARSMGYSSQVAWWRVVWPQLWPRLHAPLLAVLAYSLTVVDMALIIGPASPPTAAVLAWQWLLDADAAVNAQGSALAWLLALVVAVMAGALSLLRRHLRWRSRWVGGQRGRDTGRSSAAAPLMGLVALYAAVLLATGVGSISGIWPFPAAWPVSWSMEGWRSVAASSGTLLTTFALAITSSVCALAWALLWLENAPAHWNAALRRLVFLPLMLPPVLWVIGLHRLTLAWGLDTQWTGLWLAHTLAALPYILIALSPAYLGFETRYEHVAASLGRGRLAFLLHVKWPLLRASLWGALAVGFAVSISQYLPTLFIGGGRFDTVTTEAVGLAAGGQRSVLAAYAWLQWLLPALFFAVAAWAGRPRQFARSAA